VSNLHIHQSDCNTLLFTVHAALKCRSQSDLQSAKTARGVNEDDGVGAYAIILELAGYAGNEER